MNKTHIGLSWRIAAWASSQELSNFSSVYDLQREAQKQFQKYLNECDDDRKQRILYFANKAIESNYRYRTSV